MPSPSGGCAGFCCKAEATGESDNNPHPSTACSSTAARMAEHGVSQGPSGQSPHRPQLTAHRTKAQEAQITLTSEEVGLAYTGKQQQFQRERLDSHIPSQLKGAFPGAPPTPGRQMREVRP